MKIKIHPFLQVLVIGFTVISVFIYGLWYILLLIGNRFGWGYDICYHLFMIVVVSFGFFYALVSYEKIPYPYRIILIFLILSGIIHSFAKIYQAIGIVDSSGHIVKDFWCCLYFSIVTFTTLGYGDFRPSPDARLFAASEAIIGYLYFGVLVGVIISLIAKEIFKRMKRPPKVWF